MDALQAAIAKIEANGREWADMRDKAQSDPRHIALTRYAKSLEHPIDRHGQAGFAQMMTHLMSSWHFRAMRAADLAAVREGQIKGLPGFSKAFLKKAAQHRRDEHHFRATEPRSVTLDMATDAFCAMLSRPSVETHAVAAE